MLIGVVSDTHIPRRAKTIPREVREGLRGADLIIHCGDLNQYSVVKELEAIAPVEAVYGNTDPEEIKEILPRTKVITVGRYSVGIVHGDGYRATLDNAFNAFPFEKIDCIVFGHSHVPFIGKRGGILMLNPGSPTDKRMQEKYSYGLLHIDEEIRAEIRYFPKDD